MINFVRYFPMSVVPPQLLNEIPHQVVDLLPLDEVLEFRPVALITLAIDYSEAGIMETLMSLLQNLLVNRHVLRTCLAAGGH